MIKDAKILATALLTFAETNKSRISTIVRTIAGRIRFGGKVIAFGNGGSAADAQHLCGELVGWYLQKNRPGIPAIDLVSGAATVTAISNDTDYNYVFARQVKALAVNKDVLIGISTSGKSENVVTALEVGVEKGLFCIGLSAGDGADMAPHCSYMLNAPAGLDTPAIQGVHQFALHSLCGLLEKELAHE